MGAHFSSEQAALFVEISKWNISHARHLCGLFNFLILSHLHNDVTES